MRCLLLLPLLLSSPAAARTTSDGEVWLMVNATGSISGPLLYYAEFQPRFFHGFDRLGQVLARGAIGWKLSDKVSIFQGYGHIGNTGSSTEERSYQQLSWEIGKVAGGALSSRTRLEERWRSDGSDTQVRYRNLLSWSHPLTSKPKGLAAVVSFEPFVKLNRTDWAGGAGFDQLRSSAGLSFPVTRVARMEVGYLNQYVNRPQGNSEVNHVAQVTLAFKP